MSTELKSLFLNALSTESRDRLVSRSAAVPLPMRTALYEPDRQPRYGYFMTSGVASVVAQVEEGHTIEVGMIGAEGLAGAMHLLGPSQISNQCFMQIDGTALRIPFTELRKAYRESEEIRDRVLEFIQAQALASTQIAACHRLHNAEERLARWLLMARDRVDSDVLDLTQEFLAEMLGSRRTTVTLVAGAFQRSGLIEYSRGRVRILDRGSLEGAACTCYPLIRNLSSNLYSRPVLDGHRAESLVANPRAPIPES
jgi:CRP-like cAMP-binding protein